MPLPPFTESGDLPIGLHVATMPEILARFANATAQRIAVGLRLARIYQLAHSSGHLARFVVFGSFVTEKQEPNDVDVFLSMDDRFDANAQTGEGRLLFDHATAQAHFGASIFWLRRIACMEGEQKTLEYWQIKRGGELRGIVEIIEEVP